MIDATNGQNALTQAKQFKDAVNVTGVNTAAGTRAQGITVEGAAVETTGTGTLTLTGSSTQLAR